MLPVYRTVSKEQVVPSPFWPLTKTYLESGKLTLFISNCPSHQILAPEDVTKTWAELVGFPLPLSRLNLWVPCTFPPCPLDTIYSCRAATHSRKPIKSPQ